MSHVSTSPLEISDDLSIVQAMCDRLGWQLHKDAKTFAWYGTHVGDHPLPEGFTREDMGKCDHMIRIPGVRYEIGLVRRRDGKPGYIPMYDWWDKGLANAIGGETGSALNKAYSFEKYRTHALRAGKVIAEVEENGKKRLVWFEKQDVAKNPFGFKATMKKAFNNLKVKVFGR